MSLNWIAYTLTALGIFLVLIVAFSWLFARWWCKPKRELPSKTPANYGLSSEIIEFTSNGIPIKGWFLPVVSNPSPPVIVMLHGWSRNASELLQFAGLLNKAGFAALLFDARGHGSSGGDGPITIRKFEEDIIAGIDYLEKRTDVDTKRIGLFGRSIGGASAILAAASDRRIRALASCSAFADPEALTKDTLRMFHLPSWPIAWIACRFIEQWLGFEMKQAAPKNQIARIDAPILLVHGETDSYIKSSNMETLFALARRERAEQLLIPGRGHSDVMRDPECRQAIIAFFGRNLLHNDYQGES
jgi:pimeloyl-ACP methyl ester carboxylesterase